MSTEKTAVETSTVVGYYNGNKWPIQLVISSLNVTLHLQPGEYIKDRSGRKINDPFFEAYAKNRQLSRETTDKAVALIRVPVPSATPLPHDGQSVRQITEFTHTAAGVRVPVMPKPKIVSPQAINKNSVQGMTIEEARQRGLAHRTREVPEDYGLTDTDAALPPRSPPPLKIATDLKPMKPVSLPKELIEAAMGEMPEGRSALVQSLNQTGGVPPSEEEEAPPGFLNTVTQNAPPNSPIVAGPATPARPPVRPAPVEEALPAPMLDEPPVEEEQAPAVEPRPVTPRDKYVCMECGTGFQFRSLLFRHASTIHSEVADAIMAPYPK
jgi:hypothetical protein